jgi:CSLREA domain-containing protein
MNAPKTSKPRRVARPLARGAGGPSAPGAAVPAGLSLAGVARQGEMLRPRSEGVSAVITVNTLADENDGSCSDGDCSLRDAIQVASSGDTITFSVSGTIRLPWVNL